MSMLDYNYQKYSQKPDIRQNKNPDSLLNQVTVMLKNYSQTNPRDQK